MNRRPQKISHTERGSALLAALCFCAVLGIALASYMAVCSQTMQLSNRNSQGTHSLELAESGMEDSLWALNNNDWSSWTIDNSSSPKTATKTLSGFSFGNGVTGSATLTVENYDGSSAASDYSQGLRKLKVTGQTTLADGSTVTRKLQASAQQAPLFVNAIASLAPANGSGGGSQGRNGISFVESGTVDSFDSVSDPDAAVPGFSAVVSSTSSVGLTNACINGYVTVSATQAGDPRISYSNGVRVAGPNTSMSASIDPTRVSTSPYQPLFEIKVPDDGGTGLPLTLAPNGTTTIGNIDQTLAFYHAVNVELSGSQKLKVIGPVVLVISGNFKIQDTAQVIVAVTSTPDPINPANPPLVTSGSIQIFLTSSVSELLIGGNGIKNETKRPKNVAIFDAATSPFNEPEISTSIPEGFYGVVYAPKSDRSLTVSSDLNFFGSLVAKNVNISGSPSIHYDVDLRKISTKFSGIETPFVVSAWQETAP